MITYMCLTVSIFKKVVKLNGTIIVTSQWLPRRPKSPESRVFVQPFVQGQIKENIEDPRHWSLRGEPTGDQWVPLTKGQ